MTWVPRLALRPLPNRLRRFGGGLRFTRVYRPSPRWGGYAHLNCYPYPPPSRYVSAESPGVPKQAARPAAVETNWLRRHS
jgi:hypothetical protein